MKKILSLVSLIIVGISAINAQPTLPDKCKVFYPEVLLSSVVLTETKATALANSYDYDQKKTPRNTTFWVVYSDRDDNTTYVAPGGAKYSTVSFNEQLRIAAIKDKYALVYYVYCLPCSSTPGPLCP